MSTYSIPVTPGAPFLFASAVASDSLHTPLTLRAVPGSGGTLLVEYRIAGGGAFVAWPAGTVSSATLYTLTGPVNALRFTAATATGTVEIAQ